MPNPRSVRARMLVRFFDRDPKKEKRAKELAKNRPMVRRDRAGKKIRELVLRGEKSKGRNR